MTFFELSHYSLFPGLFVAFTYNKKEPPAFGAAPAFWCILLPFLGLSFRHIPENLSPPNVSTAEAPFFYQISGTWSNHEGSILSWCRIPSLYGFLLWGRPQSHNVSKRRGHRERISCSFVSNFVTIRYLQPKSGQAPQLYTPFVRRTLVDSELSSRRNRTFHGPALGIALFFSLFLSASSDPFVRNFFVRTEPLAESNPVLQDPILSIHPPCIYAGEVASAMGFGLCISKMMNGIVALHSPPMRRDGRLLRSAGSQRRSSLSTLPLCWTAGANTVVSDQEQEEIRIWILTCRLFLTVGISPGSWWAHHELGRGGWWFRDPVENASFMPRVSATARIHSVILPLLHSWTSLLNIVTLPCCVLGTSSIRSGLLAPVHSSATDDTRGRFLWWFFLLITGISMILFPQMKQQASVRRTHHKEMVVARSTLVHLRHSARAQPR
uniref:Cytochrome c biogenesis FN n=1 Tax=Butomus umbellatus TaxID=50236 RepID=R4IQH7_BUTUM|nr:cytochrome c biogenesis FN [Butomus umbellatus]AFY16555.1 cytochrome c biogenesis FN [Butomus umbellatus]